MLRGLRYKIITALVLTLSVIGRGQLNNNIWKSSASQFFSGAADGANQAYLFHYDNSGKFEKWGIRPNEEAWKNKWVVDPDGNVRVGTERFWLSSRSLVFVTDFHHATRFVKHRLTESSMLYYAFGHGSKRKQWYWYVADFSIMFTARSVGFYTTYNVIFK